MILYDNEKYLSTTEASHYVGKNISAFRQFINRNQDFPRRKLGGRLCFPLSELFGWFAKKRNLDHLESSSLNYDDVYSLGDIRGIFNDCSVQHVYDFIKKNNITRYCDNANVVYYSKAQVQTLLDSKLKNKGDASDVADI